MGTDLKSQRYYQKVFLILFFVLLYPATVFSLNNERWSTGVNFQFRPPGARSLGMGGAFVALADDATAAASNPAGIAQLVRMQLAIEGRYMSQNTIEDSFASADGELRGKSVSSVDEAKDLSFAAFTMPLPNNLLTLSLFYEKPISFSVKKDFSQSLAGLNLTAPSEIAIDLDEVGLSVAKGFLDGKLMLGFGVGLQFFNLEGEINRFELNPASLLEHHTEDQNSIGVSWRGGILCKPVDDFRLGVSFTIMPRFGYTIKKDTIINVAPKPPPNLAVYCRPHRMINYQAHQIWS